MAVYWSHGRARSSLRALLRARRSRRAAPAELNAAALSTGTALLRKWYFKSGRRVYALRTLQNKELCAFRTRKA